MRILNSCLTCVVLCLTFATNVIADEPTQAPVTNEQANSILGFIQLIDADILEAYENKTMEGIYSNYYDNVKTNNKPITFTETHHSNATTTYEHRGEETYTVTGIYSIYKDKLCYFYNNPEYVVGRFCFYVFQNDNCFYHFSVLDPLPTNAKTFENWTSMAYAKEDAGTCLPDIA